ncbi:MAG TPA: hypothetical protein VD866_01905, partial [Urbifossiella sp.]|nr:hypothetical protein [Urbifossiella sp.]
LSGEWVAVEEGYDTGLYEPVYNLRVADHHTYFVGDDHWGFSLWAHNTYEAFKQAIEAAVAPKKVGVADTTLRAWYDAYAVNFTMTQEDLIGRLGTSLKIVGRAQLGRIIDAATTPQGGLPFRERVRNAADAALQAQVAAVYAALQADGITDAIVGYRGSVARGEKTITTKGGYPIDWDNCDLDLFIVSDQLAAKTGNKARAGGYAPIAGAVNAAATGITAGIQGSGVMPAGKQFKASEFLVYTKEEFRRRLTATPFSEGGRTLTQHNPARAVSATGGLTVYTNPTQVV